MKQTPVKIWTVQPPKEVDGKRVAVPPVRLVPNPIERVDGSPGSDDAKRNAMTAIKARGYSLRAMSFTPEGEIVAYIDQEKAAQRRPRSAKPRRKRK